MFFLLSFLNRFIKNVFILLVLLVSAWAARGQILVSGNISGTWTTGNIYQLSGNVTVPVGQTLTIQPGVEVRFPSTQPAASQLIVQGTLTASGTITDSIRFTGGSLGFDDRRGPVIIDAASANSVLRYVMFNTLGYENNSVTTYGLIVRSASCLVENCTFRNIRGTAVSVENVAAIIRNNNFTGSANLDVNIGINNLPNLTGNNPLKIGLRNEAMTANAVLSANNLYYYLLNNFTVPSGRTLTIQPGVEVIFPSTQPAASQLIVQGTLTASGTIADSIRFTGGSLGFDDRRGPVIIDAASTNSVLRYVMFNTLGYENNSVTTYGLIVRSASCLVENCTFRNIRGTAVSVENVAAIIRNNNFTGSANLDVNIGINNLPNLTGNNPLKIGLRNEAMTANAVLSGSNLYYYLLDNFTVPTGRTLTIQPGVEVIFPSTQPAASQLIVQGTLTASGTITDSIRFTGGSLGFDDRRGPVIIDAASTNSVLRYVMFNTLGYENNSVTTYGLIVRSASCLVENCTFRNIRGTAVSVENVAAIIRNNNFTGSANLDVNIGINNLPNLTGNNPLKIGLRNETMTSNAVLSASNLYYYLLNNFTVPSGRTLTIQPGVEVIFPSTQPAASQLIVQGTLTASGTIADSIRFTGGSLGFDDRRGPVIIDAASTNSVLRYVMFNALGYENNSVTTYGLIVRSASCLVENCTFRNIRGTAVSVENVAAIIRNNNFTGSANLDVNIGIINLPNLTGNNPLKIGLRNETMTANAVLSANNLYYYLLNNFTVPSGRTLTIQPGVEVIFPSTQPAASQLIVQGTLTASGTIADSIRFTGGSLGFDDRRGPVIIDAASTNSVLRYIRLNATGYENNSETTYALIIRTSSCIVENCTISNIRGVGISFSDNISPTVRNNNFSGNINGDISGYAKNFANVSNNTNAKILLLASVIDQNAGLPYPGTNSYYALSGIITVNQGFNFTIASGTIIDFRNNSGNIVVNGSLTAVGTETGIIQFKKVTSAGNLTLGGTISFSTTSTGSILRNILIDKLGNATAPAKGAAIEINTSAVSLENINVTNCTTSGIKLNNSSPTITGSNFLNNTTAVLSTGGKAVFTDCSFVGNSTIAISNTSAVATDSIDARNCWWGAPSGPRHILNPTGKGDTIAARVIYQPFKTGAASSLVICPGGNTFLQIAPIGSGYTYQWQADNGTGFTNLTNNSLYNGVNTTTLALTGAPSSLYGTRYRIIATFAGSSVTYAAQTLRFGVSWTGTANTAWEDIANWSCGVIPDENTDVIVSAVSTNTPVINSNRSCRSLTLQNNSSVVVSTGFNLVITGK